MKFIELTRVPYGRFFLDADKIVALVEPKADPFHGHYNGQEYGCCIHAGNETFRVKESLQEVRRMLLEGTKKGVKRG